LILLKSFELLTIETDSYLDKPSTTIISKFILLDNMLFKVLLRPSALFRFMVIIYKVSIKIFF